MSVRHRALGSTSCFAALLLAVNWTYVQAAEVITIEFETQALDLDSGLVSELVPGVETGPSDADILIAYHSRRIPHAVLMPTRDGAELAVVANAGFDSITLADVPNLVFSSTEIALPFTSNDCVVVRTDQGAIFKLGNASESSSSVTFNYARLD